VYLDGNDFGPAGAEVLAQGLQGSAVLRGLSLRGNPLGEKGNLALAGALQVNSHLRVLDVAETDMNIAALIAFVTVLRNGAPLVGIDLSRPLIKSEQVRMQTSRSSSGTDVRLGSKD
jgi:hypothetical protein